jgi:DnaJ-class molecular chaperone
LKGIYMNESPDRNIERAPKMDCQSCGGKGFLTQFDDKGKPIDKKTCPQCRGTGKAS